MSTELTALRNTVNALVSAYNGHAHGGVQTGTGTSGPHTSLAGAPAAVGNVASATVKIKG